jgi:hypothetical protein
VTVLLRPRGITVELIGPAGARAQAMIEPAQAQGLLRWPGFVPLRAKDGQPRCVFPGAEKGWACSQALGVLRWRGGLVS